MKGIRLTLTTIALSVVANLISPAVQRILGCRPFILMRYWYVFLIAVLISLLFNIIGILLDKDRSDLWRARFLRVLLVFHPTKENEKAYIVNDINARVNLARRELHFVNSLLPKLVRVEWVDDELKKAETYDLNEGEFIVRVSSKNSQPRNIVDIIHATTKRTSLIGLRHIVCNNVPFENSIDEVISENIVLKINNKHIMDYYYRDFLQPCLSANAQFRQYYSRAKSVDDLGMFFTIFLTELEYFSDRITGRTFRPYLLGELENLLNFLSDITPERTPMGVALDYKKAFLRTAILLIRSEKIVSVGLENYLKAVGYYIEDQFHSFYLVYFENKDRPAWGAFQRLVNDLIREISYHATVERDFDHHYLVSDSSGQMKQARCVRFLIHDRYALEGA